MWSKALFTPIRISLWGCNLNWHMELSGRLLVRLCVLHFAPSLCVFICVSTEWSQHTSRQSERAVFCESLGVFQVEASRGEDKGSAVWSNGQTPRSLTPPGCWPGAWAGVEAGTTGGPQGQGSSGSGQAKGGRRSSGAEWCWETVVELLLILLLQRGFKEFI